MPGMMAAMIASLMVGCGIDGKSPSPPMGAMEVAMTEQDVATAAGLARSWRRQSRVLLVWSEQETALVEQATLVSKEWAGWQERDLHLVLLSSRGGVEVERFIDGGPVGPSFGSGVAAALSDRFDLGIPDVGIQVALVGKDGGVKERWTRTVSISTIFDLVDSMPMRRREMSEEAN
ncbi:MAG: hypothetical protein CMJ23_11920 [Phycisphaerae bacterium]|nr:hypothetical protein [Phycisphaerae bacterium]